MDAVELIRLYETLFYVSLGLTVLGFGLAIFFFFFFNIRDVRALMTGKARADTVRRIEEENARTGTLRPAVPGMSGDIAHSGKIGRTGRPIIEPPVQPQPAPVQAPVSYVETETAVLQADAAETAVLGVNETMVLNPQEYPETMVLNQAPAMEASAAETAVLNRSVPGIRFELTESTIVIHTNEII